MDNLKEKTAKGLFWGMLNNGTTQVLNLIFGIYLARLLSPADYGMVGVLTIFTAIAGNLQSSGFTQALVNMKRPTANDYNAVFWFNVSVSITIYIILFFCAPLIADYFRQPALVELSRFVFLSFVISAFGIAHNAYLFKNMMVKESTIIGFVALVVSGISGLVLAFNGKAYWSIAWQQIIFIAVANIGRYYYSAWHPSFHIDFSPIKQMFRFSVKILFTTIINTLSNNILTFIFGRLFPIKTVGNFTQAYKWNTMASSFISGTIAQVAQPMLAEINDDENRERRVFRKMMRFTAFLSFPAMFGLAMVSNEFIIITIHDKWADCVPLLRILCISGAFLPFYTLYQNLVISRGRSDIYLWCNIIQIVTQIALVLAFARYGITVMVTVYTLFNIVFLSVWQYFLHRLTGIKLIEIAKDICPFLLASAVVMCVVYYITLPIANLILLLAVRFVLAALFYFVIMKLAHAHILNECMDFMKEKTNKLRNKKR
ncbi:MAG: lipopolysaccharide biosynthesis protein [Prevotellaceae bacterium]|nr:lipopolysaccharide biosynthesis protein [Prevotellaceae bacterium]